MLLPQEMRAFEEPVTSQNGLVAALWPKKRCIIPDTNMDGTPGNILPTASEMRVNAL